MSSQAIVLMIAFFLPMVPLAGMVIGRLLNALGKAHLSPENNRL